MTDAGLVQRLEHNRARIEQVAASLRLSLATVPEGAGTGWSSPAQRAYLARLEELRWRFTSAQTALSAAIGALDREIEVARSLPSELAPGVPGARVG